MIDDVVTKAQVARSEPQRTPLVLVPAEPPEPARPSRTFHWVALGLALAHLGFAALTVGLRWEHLAADALLAGLPWLGRRGRAFAVAALPLWLTGVLTYNQWIWFGVRGPIRLAVAERNLGLLAPGGLDWPAWFSLNPTPVLDFLAGVAYSTHLVEVFAVGIFLFFACSHRFRGLCWAFLIVNAVIIAISQIYPAAPPWYVLEYGTGPINAAAKASAAGAARFDALLGISYFEHFYARNPNVFGAMPSGHSAYPVLVAFAVWDRGWRWRLPTLAYAVLMWFSAVYLAHHYFLDVVIGATLAWLSCVAGFRLAARRTEPVADPSPPSPAF